MKHQRLSIAAWAVVVIMVCCLSGPAISADTANQENIQQARERMAQASESFLSADAQATYREFVGAFDDWETKTRKVVEMANTPGKLVFARKASDRGSAHQAFNTMRGLIDQLQSILQADIDTELARIAEKREGVETAGVRSWRTPL